ncbi:MAG: hypothetical protein ACT6Q7_00585 [Blastomonas fulva]|uniref:hypothetical protein n=1 Tax=Blastomonas fulva TaxID=1550728 RepID=UPI0040337A5B
MNQSFESELQVVLRALGEVVLPALDGAEKHVVEQLHLSMAALEFIRQRLPLAVQFYRRDLGDYIALADDVATLLTADEADRAGHLRALADRGRAVLADAGLQQSDWVAATRQLRSAVTEAVEASGNAAYEQALDQLVLDHASAVHLRARAWNLPFGFELRPQDLPAFDS